jgi:NifU-like protein
MTPAELLDDHARRPRNVGKLLNASAVGDVGSIVVGDALRFYLSVDAAGKRIVQAKFQVFNCADQVAATSAMAELLLGMELDEAKTVGPLALTRHLGGLDPAALPPLLWGRVGLHAALAAYQGGESEHDQDLDPLLCRFGVLDETVRQAVSTLGCTTPEEVVNATGAGTGCGSCRSDIPKIIDEMLHAPAAAPAAHAAPAGPKGRIQTLLRIQQVVQSKLMPEVRSAGGDLELWDFDGRVVKVRVKGGLVGDLPGRGAVLASLEQLLKSEIDAGLGVEDAP